MAKKKEQRFGDLPARYGFVLNPYPELHFSRCPHCEHKTGQRKIPLLIHVEPKHMVALNYTCRYCRICDLLVAHKTEIEHLLTDIYLQSAPADVGNPYLVLGTVKKATWRKGLQHPNSPQEILANTSDFAEYFTELRLSRPGWYKEGHVPPLWEPPLSKEWLKKEAG